MGLSVKSSAAVLLCILLRVSQSWAPCLYPINQFNGSEDVLADGCPEYEIQNVNGKRMEISWHAKKNFPGRNMTMSYKFDEQEEKQCIEYLHDQGYNSGCLFPTEGKYLHIYIRNPNQTEEGYFDEQESSNLLKPNPPEHVTFQWADDKVTVQCKGVDKEHCFRFELQYKSQLDKDWQSRDQECCEIKDQGFDPAKCYSFRFRLNHSCSVFAYSSEWGAETHWKNGSSVDSCDIDVSEPKSITVIPLTLVMAGVLVIFALLLCVCRWERIRKMLMPAVPDPKHLYSDLFSDYNGNFQEWISKTENVLVQTKVKYDDDDNDEEECAIEEEEGKDFQGAKV
ncbi:cytokine receptor-like factor 2 [Podarcis lilfordi]|uniref:Cytokine receptor-like factor 2 n=1 Tax=Podarcis lilfordi TaxID=74358 RepID=A0AA35K7C4_9SAUR|nr:cytokine receptor-like factor 2 [Podarcis lilfordi]